MANCIEQLADYGINHGLIEKEDRTYIINRLLDVMQMQDIAELCELQNDIPELEAILEKMCDYAVKKGIIAEDSVVLRDLFDTKIMDILTPRPSEVIKRFQKLYEESPKKATDFYYDFSKATDYIRTYRVKKDRKWISETEYGALDITINLSKPEKDPKMIALLKTMKSTSYPKCQLCMENEGYAGRIDHPARNNHRIIPITINGANWGLQYSPYVYYNEHCIVFAGEHTPMQINHDTFVKLFDFVEQFPHYFLGSNADLPIVGGSILSHDHFQGGGYEFAMAKAPIEKEITFADFADVKAGIVKWPMSVIRLNSDNREHITALADRILASWRAYTDDDAFIYAETEGEAHNTITPIARMREGRYELDLVLRNNITTKEHPLGVYHPWEEYHHIKKENIGLIEVMGLAVLPARLVGEMDALAKCLVEHTSYRDQPDTQKHADWVDSFIGNYEINKDNVMEILQKEIGLVFMKVLECAGVFKRDAQGMKAFERFVDQI